jgi:hypothetical protein
VAIATSSSASLELGLPAQRGDRYRDDDLARAEPSGHPAGDNRRRPRCDAVVDDDGAPAAEVERGPATAVEAQPPGQFEPRVFFDHLELYLAEAGRAHGRVVDEPYAALSYGADREFRMPRATEFAHGQHVERRADHLGHLPGDRNAAAGQAENDGAFVGESAHGIREPLSRFGAVLEDRGHTTTSSAEPRARGACRTIRRRTSTSE